LPKRGPIGWFGGKGNAINKILPLFPQHHTYVEPFGGGAALLWAKDPSPVEVYNDIDSGLVNLFRVLRDEEKFARFQRLVIMTPYSREENEICYRTWESLDDDVERAHGFFVAIRQSFSMRLGAGWAMSVTATSKGKSMALASAQWLSAIERLPEVHERLRGVQIEHADFRQVLKTYDTPRTLFYCDPPYVHETRRAGGYRYELSDQDHKDLVAKLLEIQGMAILSGYQNSIYQPLEDAGWQRLEYDLICVAAGKTRASGLQGKGTARAKQTRVESLWLSPNCKREGLWHG